MRCDVIFVSNPTKVIVVEVVGVLKIFVNITSI